jgi:hypothetical protein
MDWTWRALEMLAHWLGKEPAPQELESLTLCAFECGSRYRASVPLQDRVFRGLVPPKLTTVCVCGLQMEHFYPAFRDVVHVALRPPHLGDLERLPRAFPRAQTVMVTAGLIEFCRWMFLVLRSFRISGRFVCVFALYFLHNIAEPVRTPIHDRVARTSANRFSD